MFTKSEYPYNLLLTTKGKTMLKLPSKLNNDILAGLYYSLSTLTQPEQDLLHLRYEQVKSVAETADLLFLS